MKNMIKWIIVVVFICMFLMGCAFDSLTSKNNDDSDSNGKKNSTSGKNESIDEAEKYLSGDYFVVITGKTSGNDMEGNSVGSPNRWYIGEYYVNKGDVFYDNPFAGKIYINEETDAGELFSIKKFTDENIIIELNGEEKELEYGETLSLSSLLLVDDGASDTYYFQFYKDGDVVEDYFKPDEALNTCFRILGQTFESGMIPFGWLKENTIGHPYKLDGISRLWGEKVFCSAFGFRLTDEISQIFITSKTISYDRACEELSKLYEFLGEDEEPYVESNGGYVKHAFFNVEDGGYRIHMEEASKWDYIMIIIEKQNND